MLDSEDRLKDTTSAAYTECNPYNWSCQDGVCDHGKIASAIFLEGDLVDLVDDFSERADVGRAPPRPMPTPIRRLLRYKESGRVRAADWREIERDQKAARVAREEQSLRFDLRLLKEGVAYLPAYELTFLCFYGTGRNLTADQVAWARFRGLCLLSGEIEPGEEMPRTDETRRRIEKVEKAVIAEGVYLSNEQLREVLAARRKVERRSRELAFLRMKHERDGCPDEANRERLSELDSLSKFNRVCPLCKGEREP